MGSLAMVMVMIPLNLFFTTLFLNVPRESVLAMLLPVVIHFNIIKAGINSTLTLALYRSAGRVLMAHGEPKGGRGGKGLGGENKTRLSS